MVVHQHPCHTAVCTVGGGVRRLRYRARPAGAARWWRASWPPSGPRRARRAAEARRWAAHEPDALNRRAMRGTGVSSGGSRACGGATGAPSQPPPSVPSLWEALARTRGRRPRWRRRRRSGGQTSRPPRRRCPIWACASLAGRGSRAFPRTGESGSWPGRRSSARSGERAPRAGKHSPRLVRAQPETGPGRDESFQVTSAHCAGADHKSHIPPTIIRSISALKSAFLLVRIAAARIL